MSMAFEDRALYVSLIKPTLLIGSCRQAQKQWILDKNLYNYPIEQDEMDKLPLLQKATHLIIQHRKTDVGYFKITGMEIVDRNGLQEKGYPVKSSKHRADTKYVLYALSQMKKPVPTFSPQECEVVLGKVVTSTTDIAPQTEANR